MALVATCRSRILSGLGRLVLATPFVAVLLLGGCGYSLGPVKPSYLKDVKTLSIPVARSTDLAPHVEVLLTSTIIKEFQRDGTFKIAASGSGDASLYVTLEAIQLTPVRSVPGNVLQASEFVMTLKIRYDLRQGTGDRGRVLDGGHVSGEASFFVSTDLQQDQRQAFPRAAEQAAQHLVSQLSEGF
jgi:Lipopolysaccharide-assembly